MLREKSCTIIFKLYFEDSNKHCTHTHTFIIKIGDAKDLESHILKSAVH